MCSVSFSALLNNTFKTITECLGIAVTSSVVLKKKNKNKDRDQKSKNKI